MATFTDLTVVLVAVVCGWLVVVLARGAVTGTYPYDFMDVAGSGWASVFPSVSAFLAVMLAIGFRLAAVDRRWQAGRPAG